MKKFFALFFLGSFLFTAHAQEVDNSTANQRVITTAVPFVQIAADARAAGMGDIGVATLADAFSQQ